MRNDHLIEVLAPQLNHLPEQAPILCSWLVSTGETVIEGDRIAELLIREFTFDISSPATGVLIRKLVQIDEPVRNEMVIALIEPETRQEE